MSSNILSIQLKKLEQELKKIEKENNKYKGGHYWNINQIYSKKKKISHLKLVFWGKTNKRDLHLGRMIKKKEDTSLVSNVKKRHVTGEPVDFKKILRAY